MERSLVNSFRTVLQLTKFSFASTSNSRLSSTSSSTFSPRDVGILGVPLDKGQDKHGVVYGPQAIRNASLVEYIQGLGRRVVDHGDITFTAQDEGTATVNYVKNAAFLGKALKKVSDHVDKISRQDQLCVTLGGDHGLAIGSLHGHTRSRPDLCVLWVDAHADINLPQTSPSMNLHGMAMSFLCRELSRYVPSLPDFDWLTPCISREDIAYIGLRDLDEGERYLIQKHGIRIFSIHDVQKHGVAEVFARAMDSINSKGTRPVHVSYDIDALDPMVAASTGTPVPGGLTYREGVYIAEEIAETGLLSSMDLVEVNPHLGNQWQQESTINAAVDIILAALGKRKQGNVAIDYMIPIPWDKHMSSICQD